MIKASSAPKRPAPRGHLRMRQYEDYVMGLKSGQVGKLVPAAGESVRGEGLRVTRAGKRTGKLITAWVGDGAVYFKAAV